MHIHRRPTVRFPVPVRPRPTALDAAGDMRAHAARLLPDDPAAQDIIFLTMQAYFHAFLAACPDDTHRRLALDEYRAQLALMDTRN